MLSIPHMIVLFIVVLVVFGPQKLPELARSLGKLMAEFRKASVDFRGAFEEEMRDLERQALLAERKKAADAAAASAAAEPTPAVPSAMPAGASSGEGPAAGTSASEGSAITPVAEAVARSAGELPEPKEEGATAVAGGQEPHRDSQDSV